MALITVLFPFVDANGPLLLHYLHPRVTRGIVADRCFDQPCPRVRVMHFASRELSLYRGNGMRAKCFDNIFVLLIFFVSFG